MNKDSQRWRATEIIELIANLIASYSSVSDTMRKCNLS